MPHLPRGVEVRVCDIDYGPATKILPAVSEFSGSDHVLVYCDDDQIYDPGWLGRLIDMSLKFPDDCIAERGHSVRKLDARSGHGTAGYRLRRIASLGLWRPMKAFDVAVNDVVDLAMGFGGVLVRPAFFPPTVFDIPDVLWTVDDIWLSGQMAINGVRIRQSSSRRMSGNAAAATSAALLDSEIEGHGRASANAACVEYFRRNHGIWRDSRDGDTAR